jgi:hypothetical protein
VNLLEVCFPTIEVPLKELNQKYIDLENKYIELLFKYEEYQKENVK